MVLKDLSCCLLEGQQQTQLEVSVKFRRRMHGLRLVYLELPSQSPTEWGLHLQNSIIFTFLQATSPKSRRRQGRALPEGSWGESFVASPSFWCSPAVLLVLACSRSTMVRSSIVMWCSLRLISPLNQDVRHIGFGVHPTPL